MAQGLGDEHVNERWEQLAHHLLGEVVARVNLAADIGTDDETAVILMFANARNHNGKATLITTLTDRDAIKKILKHTLREFHRAKLIEATGPQ